MSVGASPIDDMTAGISILVDADACPVKQEIYRVAAKKKGRPFGQPFHCLFRGPANGP